MMKHPSIELLKLMIESRIEAGVADTEVWRLVYGFMSNKPQPGQNERLSVDGIPEMHRGDFLAQLLALSPLPKPSAYEAIPQPRPQSSHAASVGLWQRTMAALKLARPAVASNGP